MKAIDLAKAHITHIWGVLVSIEGYCFLDHTLTMTLAIRVIDSVFILKVCSIHSNLSVLIFPRCMS